MDPKRLEDFFFFLKNTETVQDILKDLGIYSPLKFNIGLKAIYAVMTIK